VLARGRARGSLLRPGRNAERGAGAADGDLRAVGEGHVDQVAVPFAFSASPASIPTPPPLLGEHSSEILTEAGYDEAAIARLIELGVV